jgi:uncharacterized protein with GYD domain
MQAEEMADEGKILAELPVATDKETMLTAAELDLVRIANADDDATLELGVGVRVGVDIGVTAAVEHVSVLGPVTVISSKLTSE